MDLAPGARLDHYEIIERIGVGGMGEVYRARDTRLPREVAIKVSTVAFDERFAREAKVIASLNHPNICTLFDVGSNYLVMELVEGPTLQEHLKQGALHLDEASRIARQIAEALDYAHEHGVVHRDLKPANIKVRPDGVVKVLDFGLAKSVQATKTDNVATVTMDGTQVGAILGTPNYMSPEQATGRATDKRSDTWAFGIVFYEMLAGGKPFGGATVQESIASTLRDAPDLNKVPPQVRRLLRRCLEKDPQNRLRHLGDVMSLIDEAPAVEMAPAAVTPVPAVPSRTKWLWPVLAVAGLIAAVAIGALHFSERPAPQDSVRFEFAVPPGVTLTRNGAFSISPDGRSIVFAASDSQGVRWWLRRLDSNEAHPLNLQPGANPFPPFWSPDSRWIAYSTAKDVVKAEIAGGPPQTLCENCQALGGSWSPDGTILLGNISGILRVPASGGTPVPLTVADRGKRQAHVHPLLLPDGKRFLYLKGEGGKTSVGIGLLTAKPEEQGNEVLLETAAGVAWVPPSGGAPGRLLYMRDGTLMARPLDPAKVAFTGDAVPVAEQVGVNNNLGWGQFAASDNGTLVYRSGAAPSRQQLTWVDRSGKTLGSVGEPAQFNAVTLSPDGKRAALAFAPVGSKGDDIWIEDLAAGTRTRFTFEGGNHALPVWSPDGTHIMYVSLRGNLVMFNRRAANGTGGEELVYQFPDTATLPNLSDWSPDGKRVVFHQASAKTDSDIFTLELTPGAVPKPLLQTQFQEVAARISHDGRWYLYRSNESGRNEIYAQAVPGSGAPAGKWLISRDGGTGMVRWRRDDREVYFLSPDGGVMAAEVNGSANFESGAPRKLFDVPAAFRVLFADRIPGTLADMTSDGQRFLFAVPLSDSTVAAPLQVITNWTSALGK